MIKQSKFVPLPRWAVTRWLIAPARHLDAEARAELLAGIFRRMEALFSAGAVNIGITLLCCWQKPIPFFLYWATTDIILNVVRIIILIGISREVKKPLHSGKLRAVTVDCFVFAGTIWCVQVGFGTGICIAAGDPVMAIFSSLFAVATVGAQSARNPACPRLMRLQMSLIILPYAACSLLSPITAVHWIPLLTIPYMIGMISINKELHADYVAMIEARIDIRRRALHCALTGLPNRVFFQQTVTSCLEGPRAEGSQVAVLCLDLDGFKSVNDNFGHPMGDALLKMVASRIRSVTPPAALPARLGGDEFAIFIPLGDRAALESLARTLIASLSIPFHLGVDFVKVGVSVGIALSATNADQTFEDLFERADRALYAAKSAGKGTFCWQDDLSMGSMILDLKRQRCVSA